MGDGGCYPALLPSLASESAGIGWGNRSGGTGDQMGTRIIAADAAAACSSRSFEVQLLAAQADTCAGEIDAVLARLSQLQLADWQSPAGMAYRMNIGLQAAALRRARERMELAAQSIRRHARNVTLSSLPTRAADY